MADVLWHNGPQNLPRLSYRLRAGHANRRPRDLCSARISTMPVPVRAAGPPALLRVAVPDVVPDLLDGVVNAWRKLRQWVSATRSKSAAV